MTQRQRHSSWCTLDPFKKHKGKKLRRVKNHARNTYSIIMIIFDFVFNADNIMLRDIV